MSPFTSRNFKLVLTLALAASLLTPVAGTAATVTGDPIELPVLLPLTGYAAFFGIPQVQALRGIESYVNKTGGIQGRPLKFVVRDDQTNPQVDVQLANEIIQTRLPIMLGPDTAGQCNAVTPLVQTKGPVTFCFTNATHPASGSYVYGSGAESLYMAQTIFHYFSERGLKRVATITTTDASGQDGDRMLQNEAAREPSLTIVDRQFYNPTDVSATAQLAHIKASNPQAIVVWVTGTPFGTALRGIKDLGIDVPILASPANLLYGELKQYESLMPRELLFPTQAYLAPELVTDRAVKEQINIMTAELAALGAKPDQGHNSNWDSVMLVISALRKLGMNTTPEKLREFINSQTNWPGINGRYNFKAEPQRGLDKSSVLIVRFDPAKNTFFGVSRGGGAQLK
jgi:branched-chain amino acid transport system substrate-binding protein